MLGEDHRGYGGGGGAGAAAFRVRPAAYTRCSLMNQVTSASSNRSRRPIRT
jgi:hypothetical protein